jgi:hypothetical protein
MDRETARDGKALKTVTSSSCAHSLLLLLPSYSVPLMAFSLLDGQALKTMDVFFTSIFAIEIGINAYSFWFRPFFQSSW